MKYLNERESIIAACLYMQRSGMIRGTSGNISVRVPGGVLITPSGMAYELLKPEDISLVSLDGQILSGAKPSSELPLHLAVYRAREDVGAVVHSHSRFSTVMASLCETLPAVTVPGCEFYPVKSAPFVLPGSELLAEKTVETLGDGSAVLMEHHGLLSVGKELSGAMKAAEYVEENAEIAYWLHLSERRVSIGKRDIMQLKANLAAGKSI